MYGYKKILFTLAAIVSICILGILVYSNSFFGSFHFDDFPSITENIAIRNIANFGNIWNFWPTRFITYLSVAFNYHVNGLNVFGYHIFNLAIHIISSLLLWWLLKLTFITPAIAKNTIALRSGPIAFFISLIFLLHPIQTQAVNYIIQRATILSSMFYFLSLCLYVKARIKLCDNERKKISKIYYIFSIIAAVCSMFSKEVAISLPLTICLYEFCLFKDKNKARLKYIIPFLLLLLLIPLTMLLTKTVDIEGKRRVGEGITNISSWNYLLTQFRVMVTYLRLLFVPIHQNLDYDYPLKTSLFEFPVMLSILLLGSILISAVKLSKKYVLVSFGIFWFFVALIPESSIIPIKDLIFEHRLYLPMAGFSILLVTGLYYLFQPKRFKLLVVTVFIMVILFSAMTYQRNKIWKDEITLWSDVVAKSPGIPRPYNNLGLAYQGHGDLDRALSNYLKSIEIDSKFSEAYNNAGLIYRMQNEFDKALDYFNKALEIDPSNAKIYNNIGVVYYKRGDTEKAFENYSEAIKLNPNLAEAYNNAGLSWLAKKDFDQAIYYFNKAIEIDSYYAKAYNGRGVAYHNKGDYEKALLDYDRALNVDPDTAGAAENKEILCREMRRK